MFASVGWGELLILLLAALIILGPERLPGAVSWVMGSIRKARDYATGASSQLRDELGPEFDQIREPLSQLNELRQMTPKSVVTKHLFDGDSSAIDGMTKNVRDTLDLGKSSLTNRDSPVAPTPPTSPEEPKAPRANDVTDWDAT
ncbi:Sec-independent protein translocase protein TatB [Gordonia sp. (in: high G+C Gram-positive bacteria)]|uniref:Sec-independent protein translocase protein TatB n=1 Tax=Gordonia sp. (in: high G+C Gram-positive bacteria) TaxID=84139 RepID=UPI003C76C046